MSATSTQRSAMTYADWMAAAAEEYRRLEVLLRDLEPEEWNRPTVCEEWDVRAMVAHLVGAAECAASPRELIRQARKGKRLQADGDLVDKLNAVQVAERGGHTRERLLTDLTTAGRRTIRARSRIPAPVRALRLPFGPPLGTRPLGYLMGRIYTRDAWMHRIDLCAATGRPPELTSGHDGRIVADVVAEWAQTHHSAYCLTLTGPAGGTWSSPGDGEVLDLDAVEFCRTLSGRAPGEGLLATVVPF